MLTRTSPGRKTRKETDLRSRSHLLLVDSSQEVWRNLRSRPEAVVSVLSEVSRCGQGGHLLCLNAADLIGPSGIHPLRERTAFPLGSPRPPGIGPGACRRR